MAMLGEIEGIAKTFTKKLNNAGFKSCSKRERPLQAARASLRIQASVKS